MFTALRWFRSQVLVTLHSVAVFPVLLFFMKKAFILIANLFFCSEVAGSVPLSELLRAVRASGHPLDTRAQERAVLAVLALLGQNKDVTEFWGALTTRASVRQGTQSQWLSALVNLPERGGQSWVFKMMVILFLKDSTLTNTRQGCFLFVLCFPSQYFKAFTKDFTTGENFKGKVLSNIFYYPTHQSKNGFRRLENAVAGLSPPHPARGRLPCPACLPGRAR